MESYHTSVTRLASTIVGNVGNRFEKINWNKKDEVSASRGWKHGQKYLSR